MVDSDRWSGQPWYSPERLTAAGSYFWTALVADTKQHRPTVDWLSSRTHNDAAKRSTHDKWRDKPTRACPWQASDFILTYYAHEHIPDCILFCRDWEENKNRAALFLLRENRAWSNHLIAEYSYVISTEARVISARRRTYKVTKLVGTRNPYNTEFPGSHFNLKKVLSMIVCPRTHFLIIRFPAVTRKI